MGLNANQLHEVVRSHLAYMNDCYIGTRLWLQPTKFTTYALGKVVERGDAGLGRVGKLILVLVAMLAPVARVERSNRRTNQVQG